ncbi:haloacid dehalogenase [Epithele typhae]|uniref:haloacid dehalogenase n=1 Tax=Epithele typhae TaxID=378194 RepID=UPI0020085AE1|nr:haloacid dehalogenase [Epithele typhae]KAH9917885.1 haloacid dehalogenase [Epithele typhae]
MPVVGGPLDGAEAFVFDVFGTVIDWHSNIVEALKSAAPGGSTEDWSAFAHEWRNAYFAQARRIADGGEGNSSMDVIHAQTLAALLEAPRFKHLSDSWNQEQRHRLVMSWHQAKGWPDSSAGICALKEHAMAVALSNGNMRFLIELAKNADLAWDAIFSVNLFGTCKPDPKVYQGAIYHLEVPAEKCVMVAAHLWDPRVAAKEGMKTVYIPRATDDLEEDKDNIKSKDEGGEVDLVIHSLEELAGLF